MVNEEIIKACIKKERNAQFELFKLCYGFLMAICRRYHSNKDDAEAILNTAFLKILDNLKKYRSEVPFKLWIRRIMLNTIIDDFRKNKKYRENISVEMTIYPEQKHSDLNLADLELDAAYLYDMLDRLPDMSKRVFCLHAVDGFKHQEIARQLEISEGTSKWHVSTARGLLKEMLEKAEKKTLARSI
ncbi:MAG: sigma-70 family RNA polymerase sigma factor [Cytophagales bacterium]